MNDDLKNLQTILFTKSAGKQGLTPFYTRNWWEDGKDAAETDQSDFAQYYVRRLWEEGIHHGEVDRLIKDSLSITNLNVASGLNEQMGLIKKSLLISDLTLIHEQNLQPEKFVFSHEDLGLHGGKLDYSVACFVDSFDQLGSFLHEFKPAILNGKVFYYPVYAVTYQHTVYDNSFHMQGGDKEETWSEVKSLNSVIHLMQNSSSLLDYYRKPIFETQDITIVSQFEIPYIDNIDLAVYIDLLNNEFYAHKNVMKYLRNQIFELRQSADEGSARLDIYRTGEGIKEGIDEITSLLNKAKQKRIFQVAEAVAGTAMATLVALNFKGFEAIAPLIGGGGGFLSFLNIFRDYISEQKEIREHKYYLLWLFQKK